MKYFGEFKDRAEVAADFNVGSGSKWTKDGFTIADNFPTEDQIILASYNHEDYEGSAFVLFERDGKLYEVHGSHCSCYGLEDQWSPEETSYPALAMRKAIYGLTNDAQERLREILSPAPAQEAA